MCRTFPRPHALLRMNFLFEVYAHCVCMSFQNINRGVNSVDTITVDFLVPEIFSKCTPIHLNFFTSDIVPVLRLGTRLNH